MIKYGVKVLPRPEVLDTQGRAVQEALNSNGHQLSQCRVGRYMVLEFEASNSDEAEKQAQAIVESGLYNPLVEVYELEAL